MSAPVYAEGLVVVPRMFRVPGQNGRPGRPREGWTLHLDDCRHAKRAIDVLPAPAQPYADTVECPECHPSNPHRYVHTELPDGRWASTCRNCDVTGRGNSQRSSEDQILRHHRYAASAAALAEARAKQAPGEPMLVIVRRQSKDAGWTLHRDTCSYLKRSREIWPAPEEPRPGTVDCDSCAPNSKHHYAYAPVDGGRVQGRCICGHDTVSPNGNAARSKLNRLHERLPDGPA